jgi:hypothetical protein
MRNSLQWLVTDITFAFDVRDRASLDWALQKHLARCETLFDAIAHGDEKHREWLKQAIADHFAGKPVQPVR